PRDLEVGQPLVQQLRHLPAVRHRVELRQRAEVPQEALHLLARPERGDRREEILVRRGRPMSCVGGRRCHRVSIVTRWYERLQSYPPSTCSRAGRYGSTRADTTRSRWLR